MTTLIESIQVQVPPDHLFTHLSALWESGEAFLRSGTTHRFPPLGRMGSGLRLPFSGLSFGAVSDSELEIREYLEPLGWSAVSAPASILSWRLEIAGREKGARLTCVLRYDPGGFFPSLREAFLLKRVRRRRLYRLMDSWKRAAERDERLRRLRSRGNRTGRPDTRARA